MIRTSHLWQKLFRSLESIGSTQRKQVRGQSLARAACSRKRLIPLLEILEDRLAPSINWTAPQNISSDSDVNTNGTLVDAWSLGPTGVANTTVNGVTFTGIAAIGTSVSDGTFQLTTSVGFSSSSGGGSTSAPFANLSAPYQALLSNNVGAPNPITLTMSGLTTGHQYEFEWWSNVSSVSANSSTTASDGTGVTLGTNPSGVVGGVGQFAVGTFTAASGSETVAFSSAGNMNGFQPRNVTGPQTLTVTNTNDSGTGSLLRRHFPGQPLYRPDHHRLRPLAPGPAHRPDQLRQQHRRGPAATQRRSHRV